MTGNFQTEPLDSILQEPTSLNMLYFGKQNRKERVQKAKEDQKKVDTENMQFCPEGQRKNIKSTIEYLSRMDGVIDVSYMLSNFMNMERVFFDLVAMGKDGPFLYQMFCKGHDIINDSDHMDWEEEKCAEMPQLPFN